MRLILDSGSNVRKLNGVEDYAVVPLSIRTEDKEFVDDEKLNIMGMVEELEKTKSRSGSACPGISEFEKALDGCKDAIIITLASKLSGCYNAAVAAAEMYMEEHEGSTIYVLDSNAIGPSEKLIAEKFFECKDKGMDIDATYDTIKEYSKKLKIGFCLKSLKNLANNGRISPVIAKFANVVGIRIVGIFSEWGELQPTNKARGDRNSIDAIINNMKEAGYKGGKVIIDHCDGLAMALAVKEKIQTFFKNADIRIGETTGLCSFYAERGGIVITCEV